MAFTCGKASGPRGGEPVAAFEVACDPETAFTADIGRWWRRGAPYWNDAERPGRRRRPVRRVVHAAAGRPSPHPAERRGVGAADAPQAVMRVRQLPELVRELFFPAQA